MCKKYGKRGAKGRRGEENEEREKSTRHNKTVTVNAKNTTNAARTKRTSNKNNKKMLRWPPTRTALSTSTSLHWPSKQIVQPGIYLLLYTEKKKTFFYDWNISHYIGYARSVNSISISIFDIISTNGIGSNTTATWIIFF